MCSAYGVNFNVLTYNTIHTNRKYYTRQMRLSYSCCGKHNFEFPDFGAFNLNHNVTLTSVLHFISQFRRIASVPSPVCTEKKCELTRAIGRGATIPQLDSPQPLPWGELQPEQSKGREGWVPSPRNCLSVHLRDYSKQEPREAKYGAKSNGVGCVSLPFSLKRAEGKKSI